MDTVFAHEVAFRFADPASAEAQSMFESAVHAPPGLTIWQEVTWCREHVLEPGGETPCDPIV